jgi:hypothetical protein
MDITAKKLELLDWLMHINDMKLLQQIEKLRQQLTSIGVKNDQPIFGRLKGKIKIAPDFDAPLSDFNDYME